MSGRGLPLAMAAAGGALAVGALLGQACGDEPHGEGGGPAQDGAAGSGAASITTSPSSSSSASSSSSGSSDCPPKSLPPEVPDGWIEYADWSCDCRFYLPGTADVMPAPIAWEPCPANPGSSDCKLMKVDWTSLQTPVAATPSFDRNPDGSGVLMFRRVSEHYLLDLVGDVDGPVRFAILQALLPGEDVHNPDPGCALEANQVHDGKYLYGVRGHDQHGQESLSGHQGLIGGALGQLVPAVMAHYQGEDNYSWFHSASWIVRFSAPSLQIYAMPWSMSPQTFVTSAATDPEGLMPNEPVLSGEVLFWTSSSLKRDGINVWDPVGGTRPFIRFIGDYTRGAGDLGTDGIDLVWTYGEGKEPNDHVCPSRSIMTAPFTTDPAALQPRRLRSAPYEGIGNFQYAVGCGYAAHVAEANNTIVVRLSDGVSWVIPSHNPDFLPLMPIGLTCDEVFISGQYGSMLTQIARFRIDSLGPGIPPD